MFKVIGAGPRGRLGATAPIIFLEKDCYSGKNIIFFGEMNKTHEIDQSGTMVFNNGRKYHSVSVLLILDNCLHAYVSKPLHDINNEYSVKTIVQSPMSRPSKRFVIVASLPRIP